MRHLIFLLISTLAMPQASLAQTLPSLFDVTDVAVGDVLNIRTGPSARAPASGSFAPDVRGIEVVAVSPDGAWGRVNAGEGAGWVSMRYLLPVSGPAWEAMATPLRCFGTEPFWSLRFEPTGKIAGGVVEFKQAGVDAPVRMTVPWTAASQNRVGQVGFPLESAERSGFATLAGGFCSDGMSDREFGLAISLFTRAPSGSAEGVTGLSGCCTLAR